MHTLRKLAVWSIASMLSTASLHTAQAAPQRVMSLNLCSDQLVLDLLPPSRIASVTFLARDKSSSYLATEALRVGVNHGTMEDVIAQRPDLVIAATYTAPGTLQMLKDVGIPLIELPPATNFDQIRQVTRQLGKAVGESEKAEALIRRMDATLAQVRAAAPKRPVTIVSWEGSGNVPGRDTMFDAIVTAAGAMNIGARPGLESSNFDTEMLLMAHPAILAFGDSTVSHPALTADRLRQPLVRDMYKGRQIVYPEVVDNCGVPQSADAARELQKKMLSIIQTQSHDPLL